MTNKHIEWCCIPVTVDDTVVNLIDMTTPNQDALQKPEFRVTSTTVDLVPLDFDRYKPSLERMAANWCEEKALVMKEAQAVDKARG